MRTGQYTVTLSAGGFEESATLALADADVRCAGERFELTGQLATSGKHLIGALTLQLAAGAIHNRLIQSMFAVAMTGVESDDGFILHGLGPLGVIVELVGKWTGM